MCSVMAQQRKMGRSDALQMSLGPFRDRSTGPFRSVIPRGVGRCRRGVAGLRTSALLKTAGNDSPQFWIGISFFFKTYTKFAFSNIFKIKWPKSEEKLNFWGG